MTGESMIDYEALAQEAMRNVVRSVLSETAEKGLPGDHHFYISFDTLAPGVILSRRLREKYSEEMTIVLQHRFWDLIVQDHRFEVRLTFDGIPERLVIPFKAIKVFFDPSVHYGLQFESAVLAPVNESSAGNSPHFGAGSDTDRGPNPLLTTPLISEPRSSHRPGPRLHPQIVNSTDDEAAPPIEHVEINDPEQPATPSSPTTPPSDLVLADDARLDTSGEQPVNQSRDEEGEEEQHSAEIVRLDAFRKK